MSSVRVTVGSGARSGLDPLPGRTPRRMGVESPGRYQVSHGLAVGFVPIDASLVVEEPEEGVVDALPLTEVTEGLPAVGGHAGLRPVGRGLLVTPAVVVEDKHVG